MRKKPARGSPCGLARQTFSAINTTLTEPLSDGILSQIYCLGIDQACIRNLDLNVPDGHSSFGREKRDTKSIIRSIVDRVPAVVTGHDSCDSEMGTYLSMFVRYRHFAEVRSSTGEGCSRLQSRL